MESTNPGMLTMQLRQIASHTTRMSEVSQSHIFATSIRVEKPNDYDPAAWHGRRSKGNGKGKPPTAAIEGEKHKWAAIARSTLPSSQCKATVTSTYSIGADLWIQLSDDENIVEACQVLRQAGRTANAKGFLSTGSTIVKKSLGELLRTTALFCKHDLQSSDIKTTWPRDHLSPVAVVESEGRRVLALAVKMGVLIILIGGATAPECAALKSKLVGVTNRPAFSVPWIVQWG